LHSKFAYVSETDLANPGLGVSCFIGDSTEEIIKLDLFYTDRFIRPPLVFHNIRMASPEDIAAMKLDIISRGGRKKDFWDISELLEHFSFQQMVEYYMERYPYSEQEQVLTGMTDFSVADEMEDPVCLRYKSWELIKLDMEEEIERYQG